MYKFLFPFYYMFHTRYKTYFDKISWFIIYFIPISVVGCYFTELDTPLFFLINLMTILTLFNIYEIGYIQNDVQTIKKESNPTLRLSLEEGIFFNKYYYYIVAYKVFITLILIIMLYTININYTLELNVFNLVAMLVLLRVVFFMHNVIRNKFNILTFFGLLSLKYLIPIIYVVPSYNIQVFLGILLIFPLVRTLEHSTKLKYNAVLLQNIIKDHDKFRVKYYLFISIAILLFYMDYSNIFFILSIYFLLYRGLILLILKHKIYARDK